MQTRAKEPPVTEISTIGLDLAKNVFQVHGVNATGEVVLRKTVRRAQVLPFFAKLPPCLVGAEARRSEWSLAGADAGEEAAHARLGRARQQKGAHGLGAADQKGRLQSSGCGIGIS
jgi:hypothetical protein